MNNNPAPAGAFANLPCGIETHTGGGGPVWVNLEPLEINYEKV